LYRQLLGTDSGEVSCSGVSLGGVQRLRASGESLRQQQQMLELEGVRDRILSGLKMGKQSPEYKRTKAAIDRFISELRSQ